MSIIKYIIKIVGIRNTEENKKNKREILIRKYAKEIINKYQNTLRRLSYE